MPAPSDPATLLVQILVHELALKAGDEIPDQQLSARYRAHGHSPDGIWDPLKQAHGRDWIRYESVSDSFFLTAAGYQIGAA